MRPVRFRVRHVVMIVCFTVAGVNAGCGTPSSEDDPRASNAQATPTAQSSSSSPAKPVSVRLLWSHLGKAVGEYQAIFVARVSNPGDKPVSGVAFEMDALDASGTIVGSGEATAPDLSPHGHVDYLGTLGGTAFSDLTGRPVKIEVTMGSSVAQGSAPLLTTSELRLRPGDGSFADAPYAYDMTVKVTDNTRETLRTGVHQQVILYSSAGQVVGGGQGSSDNQPDTLQADRSYREEWTAIPAFKPATSARYGVWPEQ